MLSTLGHLASALAFLAQRGSRRRADESTHEDLAWGRARGASDLPPGLGLRWLGTAGFALEYAGYTLLIDPYITRISVGDVLRRRRIAPATDLLARWVPRADAILVGHTHFDHALDVPAIAQRTGCRVLGSTSLGQLMHLHGLERQATVVEAYRPYELGPFTVTFVPSQHSRLAGGLFVPQDGELSCEHVEDLVPQAFRCGQVWGLHIAVAGVTFYHQGSANLVDDAVRHRGVDYFLCGLAGRRYTPRYLERVLRAVEPRVIVPMHFDDFFSPLDRPLQFSFNVQVASFPDEVRRVSRDFEVRALNLGEAVGAPASSSASSLLR